MVKATKPKKTGAKDGTKKAKAKPAIETVADAEPTPETNATVGPIAGTLETQPDEPVVPVAPKPEKKKTGEANSVTGSLADKFQSIREQLEATAKGKKQPRQLRWALKSLEAAEDAANRHIKHNI